jgi:glyoxylase-like metal-dependent hydrolase (beta-lactamase superfamily II)
VLFAGDSAGLYTSGVLRLTAPSPFRPADYLSSIERMIELKPDLIGFAHFGCYRDAVTRLEKTRNKVRMWLEIAQAGVKAGKTTEQVAQDIRRKDRELDYLDTLDKDEFARDNYQFVLTVSGLMTTK